MMNRDTGRRILDESDHIRQSIGDILTTPVGSRLMRREYGSLIPELIDHPGNAANRLRLMSASIMAILRWEPRVIVQSSALSIGLDGKAELQIEAVRRGGPRSGSRINFNLALS